MHKFQCVNPRDVKKQCHMIPQRSTTPIIATKGTEEEESPKKNSKT
jgi:hypothetical protein